MNQQESPEEVTLKEEPDIEYDENGAVQIRKPGDIPFDLFCYVLTRQFFDEEYALAVARDAAADEGRELSPDLALFLEEVRGGDQ
jgi:hypothetical protein